MNVPHRIFQTWETETVPPQWEWARKTILNRNEGFEYTLVRDEDRYRILERHFPSLVPRLASYPYAVQRADLIRYVLLYLYGGVYLDLDYVCLRNLAPLLDSLPPQCTVGLVPSNNSRSHVTNSVLISRPGADFWLYVIRAATRDPPWWAVTKHVTVFATTGPLMLNRVLATYPHRRRVHIFRNAVVPCNTCHLTGCTPTNSGFFLLPIEGKSWHGWDSTVLDWMYCHQHFLLVVAVILVVVWAMHKSR